ncbi:ATP-dependent DNA helicase PIF4-like [Durio zibethinus]|uniref:ATP-dependent DNA helicase n=1 Tax=Durio zibethinus TaxID=66656 RepID=A0A6P5X3G2_DURZI|nr:ATP-dependent DNA helicase PIF4-like [Durio zibethinus]
MNKNGRSLREFKSLPFPDISLINMCRNTLIMDELRYDRESLKNEHLSLYSGLNIEQKVVYTAILEAVYSDYGRFFFVYGSGGTGKTYLWRTVIARLRSEGKIVLAVASSGIAALLLPGGRTAHSRFKLRESSCCDINQGTQLAELICKSSLIIWDEAPMAHRNAFEALDGSLRDILRFHAPNSTNKSFGGKTVALGGDFRQILPVVPQGGREDIVATSISDSTLWHQCKVYKLTINMRLRDPTMDSNAIQ